MKTAIIGGKLQGLEAAYLAGKAGWDVTVIDRAPDAPASGLCQRYIQTDITTRTDLERLLKPFDLVIPALENQAALKCLQQYARNDGVADCIRFRCLCSSHPPRSKRIDFWPVFVFQHLLNIQNAVSPSSSNRVRAAAAKEYKLSMIRNSSNPILHWLPGSRSFRNLSHGPSYSLEIIGNPGNYWPLQVTELEVDPVFDCKRVTAPSGLSPKLIADFEHIASTTAEALTLKGLMDIEVILDQDVLRVLEIDARLPSQTPITVYASTGVNMLPLLAKQHWRTPGGKAITPVAQRGVVYEHIRVAGKVLTVTGERAMASAGPLHLEKNFFGADEAITCQSDNRENWVATLIISAENSAAAWEKHETVMADIMRFFNLNTYRDDYSENPSHGQTRFDLERIIPVTRLTSGDIQSISEELPAYETLLIEKTGCTLLQLACRAMAVSRKRCAGIYGTCCCRCDTHDLGWRRVKRLL